MGGAPSPSTTTDIPVDAGAGSQKVGQSSNFRNVSACNRCRLRKNRCDQKLPSCASCDKAGVACVGYDPITKREIPRSYVYYLETRVEQLETLLRTNNIAFPPSENLEYCSKGVNDSGSIRSPTETGQSTYSDTIDGSTNGRRQNNGDDGRPQKMGPRAGTGMPGTPTTTNPRHLGAIPGLSFARVVFAAVQSSVTDQKSVSDKNGVRPYKPIAGNDGAGTGTSMRDSFFGLHTKPTIHPAAFPDKALATKLMTLYFEHANPQIPILHMGEFMQMFEQAYADVNPVRGPKELYFLNMVFAIGGGIIVDYSTRGTKQPLVTDSPGSRQCQPEEYHASAIVHLEACLGNSSGGLVELQAVLLLANFALLRPVPPGLWYIVGVAIRLAVDLGLHYEDGKDLGADLGDKASQPNETAARERGRREYIRDTRRRLWWCTYSLDRLVSVCVAGRLVSRIRWSQQNFPLCWRIDTLHPQASWSHRPTYRSRRISWWHIITSASDSCNPRSCKFSNFSKHRLPEQGARTPGIHTCTRTYLHLSCRSSSLSGHGASISTRGCTSGRIQHRRRRRRG